MHFEILVEDLSGKRALDCLAAKILGDEHSFTVHPYKGIGRIPPNLDRRADPAKRMLLNRLPALLRGYGKTFENYPKAYQACVIVVADLDARNEPVFRRELEAILTACDPKPVTRFCLAIEEGEAWFLGDRTAVLRAYPSAKKAVLDRYVQDSICGTWELLADAVHPGGSIALSAVGWQTTGAAKSKWSETIAPKMNPEVNKSPSFISFREQLLDLASGGDP